MAGKWIAALVVLAAGAVQAEAQPSLTYRITKTIPIGAPDRWDYVVLDPSGTKALSRTVRP